MLNGFLKLWTWAFYTFFHSSSPVWPELACEHNLVTAFPALLVESSAIALLLSSEVLSWKAARQERSRAALVKLLSGPKAPLLFSNSMISNTGS